MKDYRLVDVLGRGAMGVVHRAVHLRLGREVALKVLAPLDSDREARFEREIQVLQPLSHPNVVQLLDGGEHEGQLWYAMELIEGPTLSQRLKQGPAFEPGEIPSILSQILEALAYLHQKGVIHRDVTSSNVLLAPGGRVVLSDFGLARGATRLTAPGMAVGTPIYMAPEALKGDSTPASDLFSAGVVAYELFTGRNPFLSKTVEQTVLKILGENLPPPPGDDRVIGVVMRLLEREPARRWRTARDALAALADATAPKPGAAKARPSRSTPRVSDKTQVLPPGRRGAGPAVAVGLALALAAGAFVMRRPPAPEPSATPTPAPSRAPAQALELPGARVVPLVHGVRFLARNPAKAPLVIELGRGQPPAWREAARSSEAAVAQEISGLVADTSYALRVRADGFTGGLPAHAFRTLKKAQERAADDLVATLNEPDVVAANPLFGDSLSFAPADARFRQPLLDLLSGSTQLSDDQVLAIAGYAVNAPDRRLASRLVERLPTVKWTQARARVVHAAVAADLPGAAELVRQNLREWSADDLLTGLPALGHVMPPAEVAEVLAKQAGAPGHVRMLSLAPEAERCRAAAALFEVENPRDAALFGELGHLVPPGPAGDAVLEHARPERRRAALLWAPRGIACRLLPEPAPDAGVDAWAEWVRAGCTEAIPKLAKAIEKAGQPETRALTVLGRDSVSLLCAAVQHPGMGDHAAWTLAQLGATESLIALRKAPDPRGVVLWARARLRDVNAAPDVLLALADPKPATPDARLKLALAAWAAGELSLTGATTRLSAITAEKEAPAFARACARSSLSWIAGAPRPHTYLLLPGETYLDTDLSVGQLESYAAWAEPAEGQAGTTVGYCGAPLWLAPVGAQPVRLMAQVPGRLRIARTDRPVAETKAGSMLRVSIELSLR